MDFKNNLFLIIQGFVICSPVLLMQSILIFFFFLTEDGLSKLILFF